MHQTGRLLKDKKGTALKFANLKILRDRAGYTGAQVAEKLGVRRETYWRWESGEESPSRRNLMRLRALFDVDLGVLCEPAYDDPFEHVRAAVAETATTFEKILESAADVLDGSDQAPPDPRRAWSMLLHAEPLARGDDRKLALLKIQQGRCYQDLGSYSEAQVHYRCALRHANGEAAIVARALNNIGACHLNRGNYEEAEACANEILTGDMLQKLPARDRARRRAWALLVKGRLRIDSFRLHQRPVFDARAYEYLEESAREFRAAGVSGHAAWATVFLGLAQIYADDAAGIATIERAIEFTKTTPDWQVEGWGSWALAVALGASRELEGRPHLARARKIAEEHHEIELLVECLLLDAIRRDAHELKGYMAYPRGEWARMLNPLRDSFGHLSKAAPSIACLLQIVGRHTREVALTALLAVFLVGSMAVGPVPVDMSLPAGADAAVVATLPDESGINSDLVAKSDAIGCGDIRSELVELGALAFNLVKSDMIDLGRLASNFIKSDRVDLGPLNLFRP